MHPPSSHQLTYTGKVVMCMKPPLVAQTSPISNLYAVDTA